MAEAVYLLCAVTSLACAAVLLRSFRRTRLPLILWTSLCFVGLAANNVLLFIDLAIIPDIDLVLWRSVTALAAVAVILYGLIFSDVS
jgi:hypothetical protein